MVPQFKLRLQFPDFLMGPGKAELLEHIRDTGSISAAGRAMGMSYKRAWSLVEVMNAAFPAPLILSERGGKGGGGAHLSDTGLAVLAHFRAAEAAAMQAAAQDIAALQALIDGSDMSARK